LEIISTVASGASNKELAQKLAISELTVKRHLTNIFQKVGVTSRLELALFAITNEIGPTYRIDA
jgi:DNA-binding NarL/FixJ family response regulator